MLLTCVENQVHNCKHCHCFGFRHKEIETTPDTLITTRTLFSLSNDFCTPTETTATSSWNTRHTCRSRKLGHAERPQSGHKYSRILCLGFVWDYQKLCGILREKILYHTGYLQKCFFPFFVILVPMLTGGWRADTLGWILVCTFRLVYFFVFSISLFFLPLFIIFLLIWVYDQELVLSIPGGEDPGGGERYSLKNWMEVCRWAIKTLTLYKTKKI